MSATCRGGAHRRDDFYETQILALVERAERYAEGQT